MKTAFILYQNDENHEVIDFLKKSFEEVFDQYISFTNIFLNRLEPRAALAADAYLVWESSILQDVKDLVDDFSKVIMVTRSPARESLNLISAIPAGTNVLLVNDSYETALDTVYAFYEIGISHINLIPYDSALTHTGIYDQITVAVTPSEPHLVPPHIRQLCQLWHGREIPGFSVNRESRGIKIAQRKRKPTNSACVLRISACKPLCAVLWRIAHGTPLQ